MKSLDENGGLVSLKKPWAEWSQAGLVLCLKID
jgi:hypothetical protein